MDQPQANPDKIAVVKRSQARDAALQVLYQDDLNPRVSPSVGEALLEERLPIGGAASSSPGNWWPACGAIARRWTGGSRSRRPTGPWTGWRSTDRCVLRLGAYEILFGDTPNTVAIDEAIELAKRFGTAQSAQFRQRRARSIDAPDDGAVDGYGRSWMVTKTACCVKPSASTSTLEPSIPQLNLDNHGPSRQIPPGSEEDHEPAQDGHPRPFQGRGAVGRRGRFSTSCSAG